VKRWLGAALLVLALGVALPDEMQLQGCVGGTSYHWWVFYRAGGDGDCEGAFGRSERMQVTFDSVDRCVGCSILWAHDEVSEGERPVLAVRGRVRLAKLAWWVQHRIAYEFVVSEVRERGLVH
jgi:hypothetical protein